jgi:hypothetical protein
MGLLEMIVKKIYFLLFFIIFDNFFFFLFFLKKREMSLVNGRKFLKLNEAYLKIL